MAQDSWDEIEELFFRGLHASETVRQQLLGEVPDSHVVAAVAQLWADAAEAPPGFLGDSPAAHRVGAYKVNDLVEGRFRLDTVLGTGGMGQVFGAVDTRLDRPVALKFLNPRLVRHPVMRGLLEREARAVCRLAGHPNICTVHDLYWNGEIPFLVMELLAGETLAARLSRGRLPVEEAVPIGLSIVEGLAHAHARDVIHRDLKPGNVMLTPFGPKLFDFGIAKRVQPAMLDDVSILAPPGMFVGSVSYTSPEQAEGMTIDARSDIFSVGCVLYEMVTGVKAFDGASRISVLSAVLRAEPADIRDINPAVPFEYTKVVAKCLEKERSRRFQHTIELRDALDRLARSGVGQPDDTDELQLSGTKQGKAFGAQIENEDVRSSTSPAVTAIANDAAPVTPPATPPSAAAPAAERTVWGKTTPSALRNDGGNAVMEAEAAHHADHRARGVLARGNTHPISVMLSVAYGVMVGLALLVEIAYEWPTFRSWALPIAVVTCVSSIAVSFAAFAVLRRRVVNQRPHALLVTLGIFVGWSLLLALTIGPQLPKRPIVRATFQTMTANVGYPKSLLEALGLPVLAVVPLQVVCALEAELRRGRAGNVYRILASHRQRLSIPGTVVVRPPAAAIVFGIVTIWWIQANARLLENLQDGPYYGLFLELGMTRVASGLLMLFALLAWYMWTLNDLRQEAHQRIRR